MLGVDVSIWQPPLFGGLASITEAELVASLFGASEVGALYNPADTTSLFQSRTGGDQADADGDAVGIVLDKSQMSGNTAAAFIAAQTDEATNGTFDTDTDWSKNGSPAPTISGGVASFSGLSNSYALVQNMGLQTDTYYYIEFTLSNYVAGAVFVKINGGTNPNSGNKSANGTYSCILTNPAADGNLAFGCSGLFEGDIDNVVVKEVPGNPAVAPSDAARPLYKTSGGLHWLEFDGTDDQFRHDLTGDLALAIAMRSEPETSTYNGLLATDSGGSSMFVSLGGGTNWGTYKGSDDPADSTADDGVDHVLVMDGLNTGTFYKDGTSDGTYTGTTGPGSGNGYFGGEAGQTLNGRVYAAVLRDTAFGTDRALLETFFSSKYGGSL